MRQILRTLACIAALFIAANSFHANAVPVLGPGGHYYDVVSAAGVDWPSADAAATASTYLGLGGHLVTITGAAENAFVDALADSLGFGEVWGGGFQSPITETTATAGWTWVNGEGSFPGVVSAVPYANWSSGEPNDNYGAGSEQYLGVNWGGSAWNDEGNLGNITGYAIEYESKGVPDRGPLGLITALVIVAMFSAHRFGVRHEQAAR